MFKQDWNEKKIQTFFEILDFPGKGGTFLDKKIQSTEIFLMLAHFRGAFLSGHLRPIFQISALGLSLSIYLSSNHRTYKTFIIDKGPYMLIKIFKLL